MSTTRTYKTYDEMTPAEKAAVDASEDRREARKAAMNRDCPEPLNALREQFAGYRSQAKSLGFRGNFRFACWKWLQSQGHGNRLPTPESWVSAAQAVYSNLAEAVRLEAEAAAYCDDEDKDEDYEGPGVTEPWEVAYGPRGE